MRILKLLSKPYNRNRQIGLFAVVLVVAFSMLVYAAPAEAQTLGDTIANIASSAITRAVTWIINIYVYFAGALLTSIIVPVLVAISQYNGFLGHVVVTNGWALTRDLANMFFIVVLLIIAFSTMLKVQTYHYKQTLVKLLVMAVMVNFSKVISGVFIDFFQLIMKRFVDSFAYSAGGNFISAFHIYDMLALSYGSNLGGGAVTGTASGDFAIAGALMLAAVALTIVIAVMVIMIAVLAYRIVMLWLLVVLSPLAYFAYTISPKYWSQWWSEFFKHLVSGPAIAFFLWLTLMTGQATSTTDIIDVSNGNFNKDALTAPNTAFGSGFAVPNVIMNFIAMTALMMGGMVVAQKMASQSGAGIGKFAEKVRGAGTKAAMIGTGAAMIRKPFSWTSDRVGAFNKMRESNKSDKISKSAAGMMKAYSGIKSGTVGNAGKKIASVLQSTEKQKNIAQLKGEVSGIEDNIKKRSEFLKTPAQVQHLENEQNRLQTAINEGREKGEDVTALETDKKKVDEQLDKHYASSKAVENLEEEKATKSKALNKERRSFTNLVSAPLLSAANKMAQVGQREKRSAYNYRLKQIDEYKSEVADNNGSENLDIYHNAAENGNKRIAAGFKAIEQGNVSSDMVAGMREDISKMTGGDEAVMSKFETLVQENITGATTRVNDESGASMLEYKLKRNQTTLGKVDIDSLGYTGSIIKAFDNGSGNLKVSAFTSSLKDINPVNFKVLRDGLKDTALDKTIDDSFREQAMQALFAMGDLETFHDVTEKYTGADDKNMGEDGKKDFKHRIMQSVMSQDSDSVSKNILAAGGTMSAKAFDQLYVKNKTKAPIMAPAAIDSLAGKLVYKNNQQAGYPQSEQNYQKWTKQISEGIESGAMGLEEAGEALANVMKNTGALNLVDDVNLKSVKGYDQVRQVAIKNVAKSLGTPQTLAGIRWAEAEKDTRKAVVEQGLQSGHITVDGVVRADNIAGVEKVTPEHINALLGGIKDLENSPTAGDKAREFIAKTTAGGEKNMYTVNISNRVPNTNPNVSSGKIYTGSDIKNVRESTTYDKDGNKIS